MTDKEVMLWQVAQYIKPGAIVPVDMQTTQLLVNTLRAALAQPEPEPVAWLSVDSIGERYLCFSKPKDNDSTQPLYTAPPQREWVGLTDEEVKKIYTATEIKVDENWRTGDKSMMFPTTLYEAIEAKLKEKNSAT
jgi:hypothetical protein